MATLQYSGTKSGGSTSLNNTVTVSVSAGSVSNPIATGYIYVKPWLSTNAYSNTYNISVTVYAGGQSYSGTGYVKFDGSNYTGYRPSIAVYVGSNFPVNSVTSFSISDSTTASSKVFIRGDGTHYIDVDYVQPTAPTAPQFLMLANYSDSAYAPAGSYQTLYWQNAAHGNYNAITSWKIYRGGQLYTTVSNPSGYTYGSATVPFPSLGSTYSYSVVAVGPYSESDQSSTVTAYPYGEVTAPTSVTVQNDTPDAGASTNLNWSGAQGGGSYNAITGYRIYRCTTENGEYELLETVSSSSTSGSKAVTAPATMGEKYYYKIITVGARTSSGYSSIVSITAKTYTAPTAPTSVMLNDVAADFYTVAGSRVTLSWSGAEAGTNNPISGYDIYKGGELFKSVGASTSSTQVDMHEEEGKGYGYTVYAKGTKAGFDAPASVTRTVYTATQPTAPTSVTLDGAASVYLAPGGRATLAWAGASSGVLNAIAGYKIYQGNDLYATVGADVASYVVDAHPDAGSTYVYYVVTMGAHNDSVKSQGKTAYTYGDPSAPGMVLVDDAYPDANASVRLSWSNVTAGAYNNIIGYEIWSCDTPDGTYAKLTTVTSSSTSGNTTVTSPATMGVSLYYKVLTLAQRSQSGLSDAYAGITTTVYTDVTAPDTVELSSAYAGPNENVTLSWSGAQEGTNNTITGYKIMRGTSSVATVGADVSEYPVPAAGSAGNSYSYTVVTVGSHSNSVPSAAVTVYTYGAPSAPTRLSVSAATPDPSAALTLTWSSAAAGAYNDIVGYEVWYCATEDGDYMKLSEVSATGTSGSATVTAPSTMGATRWYKVKTVGQYSTSALSGNAAGITVKTYSSVTAPTAIRLSAAIANPGDTVTLSWSGAQGGTNTTIGGYEVWRATSENGTYSKLLSVAGTSANVEAHATQGSSYWYRVVTVSNPAGFNSARSAVAAHLLSNTFPDAPIVHRPASTSAKTYNPRPYILVEVGDDQNEVTQTIRASGYDVSDTGALTIGRHVVLRKSTALTAAGSVSGTVYAYDSLEGQSEGATFGCVFTVMEWTDETLVAGLTPIKAAHINELRSCLDDICDYYGLARTAWAATVTAKVTSTLGWVSHVTEIQNTIIRIANYINDWDAQTGALNVNLPAFITARTPTAAVILQLRELIKLL